MKPSQKALRHIKLGYFKIQALKAPAEIYSICLMGAVFIFCVAQTENLYILPWWDEFSYLHPSFLNEAHWSFFLPWNYRPEHFMGHPMLHPLTLWSAFHLFAKNVAVAKTVALGYSLLCLFALYQMTKILFQDKLTAFFSTLLALSMPLFWLNSTLVLADIPLMAFGFGVIYAWTAKKYKTLLLFSLGLAIIRESALAFFLPLIIQGIFIPAYRKSLFVITPSLLLFFSHFLIFFIRTNSWIAHPYMYEGLPHNPDPVFFDFSIALERLPFFSKQLFHQYPILLYLVALSGLIWIAKALFKLYRLSLKKSSHKRGASLFHLKTALMPTLKYIPAGLSSPFFAPLSTSALFFAFFINYPNFMMRNFFPLFVLFIPFSVYIIIKTAPSARLFLGAGAFFIISNMIYPGAKESTFLPRNMALFSLPYKLGLLKDQTIASNNRSKKILEAKSLAVFLESEYGSQIRRAEKRIYAVFPYDKTISHPFYGYVKNFYKIDLSWRFFKYLKDLGAVAFHFDDQVFPFPQHQTAYNYIIKHPSWTEVSLPSHLKEDFALFIHKDLL